MPRFRLTWKQCLRWLLPLLILGVVLINVLAWHHAGAMMFYAEEGERTRPPEQMGFFQKLGVLLTGVKVPRPESELGPESLHQEARELFFDHEQGIRLCAWLQDADEQAPLVLMFHGYGAEKTALLREAHAWLDLKVSVLLVDFRGSGGSSESYTSLGIDEAEDVALIYHWARSHYPQRQILLHGTSMGAAAILKAVAEEGLDADALILELVFDTMPNTVANRFRSMGLPAFPGTQLLLAWGSLRMGRNAFAHQPMKDAESVHIPSLFFQGEFDPRATLEDGKRVYNAVPGEKEFVIAADARHQSILALHPELWNNSIQDLLRRLPASRP